MFKIILPLINEIKNNKSQFKDVNKLAVCILLVKKEEDDRYIDYHFLAVSLKNDHEDFNMPGGKVEKGETITEAAVRELKEETGIDLGEKDLKFLHLDIEESDNYMVGTYYHIIDNTNNMNQYNISTEENHKVQWMSLIQLTKSKIWSKYNTDVYNKIKKYIGQ